MGSIILRIVTVGSTVGAGSRKQMLGALRAQKSAGLADTGSLGIEQICPLGLLNVSSSGRSTQDDHSIS